MCEKGVGNRESRDVEDCNRHWIHEFVAREDRCFDMIGFYERLLDMSERGEVPINVPHRCCDPVRDPVREINDAHASGDLATIMAVRARIAFAIYHMEERLK